MRVAIGSDHAGFELKEALKTFLAAEHHEVVDVGTHSQDPVDYPDYAQAVGAAVRESRAERGILLCGSGVGASMVANRIPGIRAGLCHDTYSAHQGVEHDDMNVLVLGGRVIGIELARELIRAFLNARFTGDPRHLRRLAKMTALENRLRALEVFGQSVWLDYIRRSLIESGELRRLIVEDGVRGITSNPAIFEKPSPGAPITERCWRRPRRERWMRRRCTRGSPSATFRTRATRFGVCTRRPPGATATSAWRCRRSWHTTRWARWTRRGGSGPRSAGTT
jgi:ribose 5-phosphate isomerase B